MRTVLGLLLLVSSWHPSSSSQVSLHTYVAGVHRLRIAVDALHTPGPAPGLRSKAAALYLVRLSGGRVMRTGLRSIAAGLTEGPEKFAVTRRLLDSLDDALRSQAVRGPSAAENAKLRSILAGPDFHPTVSPIDRFKEWLAGQIGRFLTSLEHQLNGHPRSFGLVGLAALAAIIVLAFVIGRGALGRVTPETAAPLDFVKGLTASQAFARADALSATGDYLGALRTLFAATLLRLGELDYLELRVGMTNREYLLQLRRGPAAVADSPAKALPPQRVEMFERLTSEFEVAWYGRRPVDSATYRASQELARTVTGGAQERVA